MLRENIWTILSCIEPKQQPWGAGTFRMNCKPHVCRYFIIYLGGYNPAMRVWQRPLAWFLRTPGHGEGLCVLESIPQCSYCCSAGALSSHTHSSSLAHIQELRMHRAHRIQLKASQKCDRIKGWVEQRKGEDKGRWWCIMAALSEWDRWDV